MTNQCPWPSGLHAYRGGKCTRCGAVEVPEPVAARTVSDVAAWGALAVTYSGANARTGVHLPYRQGVRMAGPVLARTGLQEGEDTRGGSIAALESTLTAYVRGESATVPHGDRGEHP